MTPVFFTFDYDYDKGEWNLPRSSVPPQLKGAGVSQALWMHFWDYAQSVVERAKVRGIMRHSLEEECAKYRLRVGASNNDNPSSPSQSNQQERRQIEMDKLEEQTKQDFTSLQRQAERFFPQARVKVSVDVHTGRPFGLAVHLMQSSYQSPQVQFTYDERRAAWTLPRHQLPLELLEQGVSLEDWVAIWDHAVGVQERALERESLNALHEREWQVCLKSLSYMKQENNESHNHNNNTTAHHLKIKMEKLQRAQEANRANTLKGWHELLRRANQRLEPHGVHAALITKPTSSKEQPQYMGLTLQKGSATINTSGGGSRDPNCMISPYHCSFWLPGAKNGSPTSPSTKAAAAAPAAKHWATSPGSLLLRTSPSNKETSASTAAPTEKENAPPKPEDLLKHRGGRKSESSSLWEQPIVVTFMHDAAQDELRKSKLLTDEGSVSSTSSTESSSSEAHAIDGPVGDDDDDSSIGIPPAPNAATTSEQATSEQATIPPPCMSRNSGSSKPKKTSSSKRHSRRRVRFGRTHEYTYEKEYTSSDKRTLWYSHEDRENARLATRRLAQRVLEQKNSHGSGWIEVLLEAENTHEEIRDDSAIVQEDIGTVTKDTSNLQDFCWRGLEHAKRGDLHMRQDIRRSFVNKVLEKQRLVRMEHLARTGGRRGTTRFMSGTTTGNDPATQLQQFASKNSRACQDRALRLAGQDARDARAVYKESLRPLSTTRPHQKLTFNEKSATARLGRHSNSDRQHSKGMNHPKMDIFQEYCRQMHLASRTQQSQVTTVMA